MKPLAPIFGLWLLLFAQPTLAQETGDPNAEESAESEVALPLEDAEGTVEVLDQVDDPRIASRLREILATTGRYAEVELRVDNGVVFLGGTVDDSSHSEWVKDLARRTEGVVAVLNDIQVTEPSILDLQPAVDELREIGEDTVRVLPLLVLGLGVLLITILGARTATRLLSNLLLRRIESRILRDVLSKAIFVALLIGGIYVALRVSGLTRVAVTIVGGTGVAGLVLGFAFRDIAENFLASLLISIQRPFRIGDTIEVDGKTGVVQRVTTRGTVLMDFDGNHIQLANATVYKSTIKNFTANPKLRLDFGIGIGFDASIARAQDTILEVLKVHRAVLEEPGAQVLVQELGSATINLRIYCWIDGQRYSKMRVRSALMRQVVRALEEANISMPDEAREVVFPQSVPVQMLDEQAKQHTAAAPRHDKDEGAETTAGEGDLTSEVEDLHAQARSARDPEESGNVM